MTSNDFGMHIVNDDDETPMIPAADAELRDFGEVGEAEALPEEDVEAQEHVAFEARDFGVPGDAQPDTQGEDPLVAELGDDGQGELSPGDLPEGDDEPASNEPDGLFDSQDMPTADGEMADGGEAD